MPHWEIAAAFPKITLQFFEMLNREKENLVLLHGWGMNSTVWSELVDALQGHFRIHRIELYPCLQPDRGDKTEDVQDCIECILEQAPQRAHWLGWSLGGMLAMQLADQHPARVQSLILIATNAVFCRQPHWENAMVEETFNDFKARLLCNSQRALQEFVRLQFLGVAEAKRHSRALLELTRRQKLSTQQLNYSLDLLARLDGIAALKRLRLPCLMINGARDKITPVESVAAMRRLNPNIEVEILKNAGHAPFICHPKEVAASILQFSQTSQPFR